MVLYGSLRYSNGTVCCSVILCGTVWCSVIMCGTVWCSEVL